MTSVNRRAFVSGLGAVLAAPLGARAQQIDKVHRVGFLHIAEGSFSLRYLKPALAELGYVEGKNLILDTRFARGDVKRLRGLAEALVQANVVMILAAGDPAVRAAKAATKTIPIVMAFASLPIEHGFVSSLARPGGNVTGVTVVAGPDVDAKRVELLREIAPAAKTISLLRVADAHEGSEPR
jgi:putative ABC transport system substrate-binding protein